MHSRSEVTKSYNEIQTRGKIQESPEVQPLTLLYTSFDRKGTTFFINFYGQMVPLSHTLFRTLHLF